MTQPTETLIWTFLQWFLPLSTWRKYLTKLMGNHNIWKMDDHMSNKITCIFIFHRPYMFNTNTKLLWTINNAYEYQTVYDMDVQWPTIYPLLMEFLCKANSLQPDYPHNMFILPDVHTPPLYFQDSQDTMSLTQIFFVFLINQMWDPPNHSTNHSMEMSNQMMRITTTTCHLLRIQCDQPIFLLILLLIKWFTFVKICTISYFVCCNYYGRM
ncbi:hypothetical protein ACOSQ2_026561 [Xanthoceras sorbifolium]